MRNPRWLYVVLLTSVIPMIAVPALAKDKPQKEKKITLAAFDIKGGFPETASSAGIFGELEQDLRRTIARIEQAGESDEISGIVLRLRNPSIGRAKVNELRTAITRARKSGTKIYADIESGQAADYLIACACDEIVMPPSGALMVTGVRAEVMFYKGLLEKVGVQADMIQMGDFKGAAEPYMRDKMSPELRAQYTALIDDYYDQLVTTIANDRSLDVDKVKKLVDKGLFTAETAKKAGLIDRIAYADELKQSIREQQKADAIAIVRNYGKQKVDTDFSGFGGMMKLMNLMMGNAPTSSSSGKDKVAIVYAVGAIMPGASQTDILGSSSLGSDTIVKALRKANEDKKVRAIVLRVDSPGGSAIASDMIWREIEQIEKPIIASMGDIAASGGYYISMGADKIFAEPGTLTGSIGVVGGKMAMGNMFKKIGITTDVVSRGKNSGLFSANTGFSNSERAAITKLMEETYKQFTTKAAEGRKMKLDRIESLAQGKVYSGRQAKENGLVDELGTLRDAVMAAKKAAGIDEDKKVELMILPKPQSFFEQMLGGPSIETRAAGAAQSQLEQLVPQLSQPLAEAALLQQMFRHPVNLIMPYRVEIK